MAPTMYDRSELTCRGIGPYPVSVVDHCTILLKDGTKIAVKIWLPTSKAEEFIGTDFGDLKSIRLIFDGEEKKVEFFDLELEYCPTTVISDKGTFPTVMEYIPYRKSDRTAHRDHQRHPWMASHGYVVARPDIRGNGESTGLYFDEYSEQEQADGCEIIDWIASRGWSNGRVGVYGKSWGGFNGLQLAYCQPKGLKAVISLYSTDNRYTDDIHWKGGCVLGNGMLSWASTMFAWNAKPPHPDYFGDGWKEEWKKRLEAASKSWDAIWLANRDYNAYWKNGSVCEDYSRVAVPVLAIGGYADAYTNAVFRLADRLPKCRGLIGAWAHDWPDVVVPGPNINFMKECKEFWDAHLKEDKTSPEFGKKKMTWFEQEGTVPPTPQVQCWPGKWKTADTAYPTKGRSLILADDMSLSASGSNATSHELVFDGSAGLLCGEWLSFGEADIAYDQRGDNAHSLTWHGTALEHDETDLFGFPVVTCDYAFERGSSAHLIARLCDVFPDGKARLISWGAIKLTGKRGKCKLQLDGLGYSLRRGHRICVSLSTGSWPAIWPTPDAKPGLVITSTMLELPVVDKAVASIYDGLEQPEQAFIIPSLETETLREPNFQRSLVVGLSDSSKKQQLEVDAGNIYTPYNDTRSSETEHTVYAIDSDDPLSAKATIVREIELEFRARNAHAKSENVLITTVSEMSTNVDGSDFVLKNKLTTKLNGELFFEREWRDDVPAM